MAMRKASRPGHPRVASEVGAATAEYCTGAAAAAAIAMVLWTVLTDGTHYDLFVRVFDMAYRTHWFSVAAGLL